MQFYDGNGNFLGRSTDTDVLGSYLVDSLTTPTNSLQIRVYTQDLTGTKVVVSPLNQPTFRWLFFSPITPMNGNVVIDLTFPAPSGSTTTDDAAHAFSVFDAMMTYWVQYNRMSLMSLGTVLPLVTGVFPGPGGFDRQSQYNKTGTHALEIVRLDSLNWDVVGKVFFELVADRVSPRLLVQQPEASGTNVQQAWTLGLAVFMTLAIQASPPDPTFPFPAHLAGVNDGHYTGGVADAFGILLNPPQPVVDPGNIAGNGSGAFDAVAVLGVLWALFTHAAPISDGVVTEFTPQVTPLLVWNALTVGLPCNPCDTVGRFWTAIATALNYIDPALFLLANDFVLSGMAPEARLPVDGASLSSNVPPTFTWRAPGVLSALDDRVGYVLVLSRDQFHNDIHVLTSQAGTTSYTPSVAQWQSVLGSNPAGTYQWFVLAQTIIQGDALALPEGWYWYSNLMHFSVDTGVFVDITVTVNDAVTGHPIVGATVTAGGGGTQTTDANGQTTFNLLAGPPQFTASAPGYTSTTITKTVVQGQSITISLQPLGTGLGRVIVTVKDAVTGQPIAGAAVAYSNFNNLVGQQTTNASGQATFPLAPGSGWNFSATAPGYNEAHTGFVTVVAGQDTAITISLQRALP